MNHSTPEYKAGELTQPKLDSPQLMAKKSRTDIDGLDIRCANLICTPSIIPAFSHSPSLRYGALNGRRRIIRRPLESSPTGFTGYP